MGPAAGRCLHGAQAASRVCDIERSADTAAVYLATGLSVMDLAAGLSVMDLAA